VRHTLPSAPLRFAVRRRRTALDGPAIDSELLVIGSQGLAVVVDRPVIGLNAAFG